jgi:hypothetical protein
MLQASDHERVTCQEWTRRPQGMAKVDKFRIARVLRILPSTVQCFGLTVDARSVTYRYFVVSSAEGPSRTRANKGLETHSLRIQRHLVAQFSMAMLFMVAIPALFAQTAYQPPPASSSVLKGIPFATAVRIGEEFTAAFKECDAHYPKPDDPPGSSCFRDKNNNTVILEFNRCVPKTGEPAKTLEGCKGDDPCKTDEQCKPGGIFFDAKLGIDADGSPLAQAQAWPNQADTSLRYPPGKLSLDSEQIPYIVIPKTPSFSARLHIQTGDIGVVVWKDKVVYAIVGDTGPVQKIGEGSMALHDALGHPVCTAHDQKGICTHVSNNSIERGVLYIIFPDTRALIYPDLTPVNLKARLATLGPPLFARLKASK